MMQPSGQAVEVTDDRRTGPDAKFAAGWAGETCFTKAEDDEPADDVSRRTLDSQLLSRPGETKDDWVVSTTGKD